MQSNWEHSAQTKNLNKPALQEVSQIVANISVAGTATFNSNNNSIIIGDGTNGFGTLDFSGSDVTITENSATQIATSNATGALVINSSGAIAQTGAIDADSTSSFNAGANSITLTNSGTILVVL